MTHTIPQEWPPFTREKNDFSLGRLHEVWDSAEGREDVFWRHDVDYDLVCAVKMAMEEKVRGIKSTFYFRAFAEEYGVEFDHLLGVIRHIKQIGHDVGFHIDLMLPRSAYVPASYVLRQYAIQSKFLRQEIMGNKMSLHAPPGDALWRDYHTIDHCMGPQWKDNYSADSRGVFRGMAPEEVLRLGPAQINLHPEWWFLPKDEADTMRTREAGNP